MAELIDTNTDQVHGQVDSSTTRNGQSKACEPCNVDNNMHLATGWCETCDERLCNDCYKAHCIPTIMRNHQLWPLQEMENRKNRKKVTNKCKKHGNEALIYFCEDHKELGCNQCFVSKHRQCSKVVCISEVTTAESDEFKALEHLLSEIRKRLKTNKEKTEMNVSITSRQHDGAIAEIKGAGEKLKRLVDTLVKEQITKAEQAKCDNMNTIGEVKEMTEEIANEVSTARDMLAAEQGDNNQLFITMKYMQTEAKVLESKLRGAVQKNNSIKKYKFVFNPELVQLLEATTELGSLKKTWELKMDKATDEVVEALEVMRFCQQRQASQLGWAYRGNQDAIQISTDRDIRLLYVLLYPCRNGATIVDLSIKEGERSLTSRDSTHAKTGADVIAVKVVGEGGVHGVTLHAGHRYDVGVVIKGNNSDYGGEGLSEITVGGVKFTFSRTTSRNNTGVKHGQIPGVRFVPL